MSDTIYVEASCSICEHSYNSEANRPLVLPCSHSFCQDCLQKLEAAGDKLCPVCRKTWRNARISGLPTCYQLIPAEGCAVRNETRNDQNDCEEHGENYIFWCTSCDVPACRKCWKLKHGGCEFLLIEDKYEVLGKECLESLSLLKDDKQSYLPVCLSSNETHLMVVKELIEKLQILEKELMQYHKTLDVWEKRADGILSYSVPKVISPQSFLEIRQKTSEVETLTQELQAKPSSLLLQMACSYKGAAEDADAFVTNLKSWYGGQQTDRKSNPKLIGNKTLEKNETPDLKDRELWLISDLVSASAVYKKIVTSSARPSRLRVTWTNKPEHVFGSLHDVGRQCETSKLIPAEFDLDCFLSFEKQCTMTRALTSSLADEATRRFHITQFCGHLDAAAIQKLPTTIKSVGLVLRDQEDMSAVNALCGTAFGLNYQTWIKDYLLWRNWTELNLSIASTFEPAFWRVTWHLVPTREGRLKPIKMLRALRNFGVRLRLHLPQLRPEDLLWLKGLLSAISLDDSTTAAMFLHGSSVEPDPLLGLLRDSSHRWEVHFPTSLPQLVPRKEVTAHYKKYGHCVTWDLE